jgi:tetratricopeptide (TPR) repeat protein
MRYRVTVHASAALVAIVLMSAPARFAVADDNDRDFYEFMRSGRAPEALNIAERRLFAIPATVPAKPYALPRFVDVGVLRQIAFVGMAEPFVERFRSEIRRQPTDLYLRAGLAALLYADWNPAEADVELARLFTQSKADTAYWHEFAAGILEGWNRPYERVKHLRRATELPVTAEDMAGYITARAMSPSDNRASIAQNRLLHLADALLAEGEWAQALECCDKAVAAGPTFARGIAEQPEAKARAAIKEAESRIAKLDKLIDPQRGDPQCAIERADLLLRVGRVKEAAEYVADHLLPFNPHAHAGLAEAYARLGRTDEAIAEYQIALELTPVIDPRPWLHIGPDLFNRWMGRLEELCQTTGKPQAMVEAYDKERGRLGTETAARPALVSARIRLNLWRTTAFMLKNGRSADVVNLWAQGCRRFPDDAAQAVAEAVALGVEPAAALTPFSAARADGAWLKGARIVTAAVLHAAGRTEEANAALVELSGTLAAADIKRLVVANMLDCQGDTRDAVKAIQPLAGDAQCEKETRAPALRLAICLHLACAENAAAVKNSEELLRLYPDDMNARRQWAAALAADGRPLEWWGITQDEVERHKAEAEQKATAGDRKGALVMYRRLSDEARPSDGLLAIRAAEFCRAENDAQGEVAWLQRAHMIDQARFGAAGLPLTNRLAELYRARNDIRGLAALERRNRREAGDEALVLARYGHLREALGLLEGLTANAPDDYPAYVNRQALARLYIDSDRAGDARILCNSLFDYLMAKQKFDTSHGLFLANAFGRLGEYEKALVILDHTEKHQERGYAEWIDQARERLTALKKLARP